MNTPTTRAPILPACIFCVSGRVGILSTSERCRAGRRETSSSFRADSISFLPSGSGIRKNSALFGSDICFPGRMKRNGWPLRRLCSVRKFPGAVCSGFRWAELCRRPGRSIKRIKHGQKQGGEGIREQKAGGRSAKALRPPAAFRSRITEKVFRFSGRSEYFSGTGGAACFVRAAPEVLPPFASSVCFSFVGALPFPAVCSAVPFVLFSARRSGGVFLVFSRLGGRSDGPAGFQKRGDDGAVGFLFHVEHAEIIQPQCGFPMPSRDGKVRVQRFFVAGVRIDERPDASGGQTVFPVPVRRQDDEIHFFRQFVVYVLVHILPPLPPVQIVYHVFPKIQVFTATFFAFPRIFFAFPGIFFAFPGNFLPCGRDVLFHENFSFKRFTNEKFCAIIIIGIKRASEAKFREAGQKPELPGRNRRGKERTESPGTLRRRDRRRAREARTGERLRKGPRGPGGKIAAQTVRDGRPAKSGSAGALRREEAVFIRKSIHQVIL